VSLWQLVVAGAFRNRGRFALTVFGVAAVIAGLVLVRTVADVWQVAVQSAAQDRLIVRSSLPLEAEMPLDYAEKIKALDGEVISVTPRWALDLAPAGKRARRVIVELDASLPSPDAVLVPAELGWAQGSLLRVSRKNGAWRELRVAGWSKDKGIVQLHPEASIEPLKTCHEAIVKIGSPALGALIARKIDAAFAEERVPTISQSEHDAAARNARALGGLFTVIDLVSITLLLVLGAVVAGMIVFSTGERTTEYAVLRALGFSPALVGFCVSGEALIMAVSGAVLGLLGGVMGAFAIRVLSSDAGMASVLPEAFYVSPTTLLLGFIAATSLALLASLVPAIRASRVAVADELRRQG